jgi:antitoxin component YwqK of YwqJK toxin-antitoxin module
MMKPIIAGAFAFALAACSGTGETTRPEQLRITQPVAISADENGFILASIQMDMKNVPKDQIINCSGDGTSRIVKTARGAVVYNERDVCKRADGIFTDKKFQPLYGIVEARYDDGSIMSETGVKDGRADGDSIFFSREGDKIATDVFKDGVKISSFTYWPDETPKYAVGYDGGRVSSISMYNADGAINWTSDVENNALNGDYRLYRDDELYAEFVINDNLIVSGEFIEGGERRIAEPAEIIGINEGLAITISPDNIF